MRSILGQGALPDDPVSNAVYDDREFARYLVLAASGLVLLVVPAYQLVEFFLADRISSLWWQSAGWRALAWIAAAIAVTWCTIRKDGHGSRSVLRLLTVTMMVMMFGLFGSHYLHVDGDVNQMVSGLIIVTFVVSLGALRGARELLAVFGLPMALTLAVLTWKGEPIGEILVVTLNVWTAFGIALVTSELLVRTRMRSFRLQQELREHATTDPLTGLSNRRYIKPQLRSEIARAGRHGTTFTVVMADLDFFKRVNDEHGHGIGDEVLGILAARIRSAIRREDRPVRWGGEEFLVLMPEIDADQAYRAAERIRHAVGETPFEIDDKILPVTISLGVAEYAGEDDPEALVDRADQALYRAKQDGRNRTCVAPT